MQLLSTVLSVALVAWLSGCEQGGKTVVKKKAVGATANAVAHGDCNSQKTHSQHALTESGHEDHSEGAHSGDHGTEDPAEDGDLPSDGHDQTGGLPADGTPATDGDHSHEDGRTTDDSHPDDCQKKK